MNPISLIYFTGLWLLLCLPQLAFSQTALGIKAGMNMGDIKVRSENLLVDEQYAPLRLWHVGVAGSVELSERFSGQMELLFNQKGGQSPLELGNPNPLEAYWQYKLNYLSLPVLLQFKAGPLTFEAGPEVSYLLGHKTTRNDVVVEDELSFLGDKSFEFALTAGFKFSVERFFTEVRWTRGYYSIGEVDFYDMDGVKLGYYNHFSHTLQVSLGYVLFPLKKDADNK